MKKTLLILPLLIGFSSQAITNSDLNSDLDIKNQTINESLISGWKPFDKENNDDIKASFKTIQTLNKYKRMPSLKPYFREASGYAVFPNITKIGFGFGGARGKGEVFENSKVIGSSTVTQLTFGYQLGAQAFSQIVFFQNKRDLDRFIDGNFEFGASVSAALITEGANATADFKNGVAVMTFSKGGLMYEASVGGQKFTFDSY
tara:strand:+ start:6146 stop:6754 length:609 start_codon:yes stop_codon:yes gene_type:complete